ncbi:hypothetical protein [Spongiactinospora sp. TRM90649]|uniref:hypothetical protein n=1 Tax=Spongiactinospora sp. TRM90649 TaxID=3031114 RepID=UPI0023F6B03B|nr:hypothetical protein [Spongiactinospora sp. TRM90649]MDF5755665.1 hypothetical protein [Spongiactinospora sp. TRM90649]
MDELTPTTRNRLAALEQTFPGWEITLIDGVWTATRHDPPGLAELALGIHHKITRPTPAELAQALAGQLAILMRTGRT